MAQPAKRLSTWQSPVAALSSWRTASVALQSFSSVLPLGLVWIAIPDRLTKVGVDLRVAGLVSLAQAPWTFKFFGRRSWSGTRRRDWGGGGGGRRWRRSPYSSRPWPLAEVGDDPDTPWIVGALALAIAFAAATQDIAIDAYAVEVLRPRGAGRGGRGAHGDLTAAMYLAGGFAILPRGSSPGRWSMPCSQCSISLSFG